MKRYGQRIRLTPEEVEVIKKLRDNSVDMKNLNRTAQITKDSKSNTVTSDNSSRITNLEQLIEHAPINTEKWEITNHIVNKWENFSASNGLQELWQVKAWLKLKGLESPDSSWTEKWLSKLKIPTVRPERKVKSGEPIVVVIGDLHIGAYNIGMKIVQDYNVDVVRKRLTEIATVANSFNRPVYVFVLGDLIESFTGKNKKDTWKQIEMYGAEVALTAYDLLKEFFDSIEDVRSIKMVGGNHDRMTDSKEDDNEGEIAKLIKGIFDRTNVYDITFDSLIETLDFDEVKILGIHGDKMLKKKNSSDIVLDYGDSTKFNILLGAHIHSRNIYADRYGYRAESVSSIYEGGKYEQYNNWNSRSGWKIIDLERKVPTILDYSF